MYISTGDEAGTHGEDSACIGVVETSGVLIFHFKFFLLVNYSK